MVIGPPHHIICSDCAHTQELMCPFAQNRTSLQVSHSVMPMRHSHMEYGWIDFGGLCCAVCIHRQYGFRPTECRIMRHAITKKKNRYSLFTYTECLYTNLHWKFQSETFAFSSFHDISCKLNLCGAKN